jgi:class 3 adenylate cyclase
MMRLLHPVRRFVPLLALLMLGAPGQVSALPRAVDGVIVLSEAELRTGASLEGDWEFAWGRLLGPGDFAALVSGAERTSLAVPGSWSAHGTGYPAAGYGTYRLVAILPSGLPEPIGITLKGVGTAFRLYCNGVLLLENGRVSTNLSEMRGSYAPKSVYLDAQGRLEIIVQVSNAEDTQAGLEEAPFLGLQSSVESRTTRETLLDAIIYAAILIMGLYHILLAILHPDERSSLYFGILAVVLALRGALTGARLLHQFAGGLGLHSLIAAEYITVYVAAAVIYQYFSHLFPRERLRFAFVPIIAVNAGLSAFAILAPVRLITAVQFYYELFLLCEGLLIVVWIIRSLVARREGSFLMLVASLVMLLSVVHDIVVDVSHSGGSFLTSYAMLVFVFLQSGLLARRYVIAYLSAREQTRKAEGLATSFARFVPKEFLGLLGKDSIENVSLGDQIELQLTVLFTDIRSFTTLSEDMTPTENFNFLNSFLSRISPVVRRNSGFIDKYLGDGVMALFPRTPMDGVRAGLDLMETVRVFNLHRANSGYRPIGIGVGINTGTLMLGTIGESFRMEGTVISDAVNLASRLEGLTRMFGSWIIVSGDLLAASPEAAQLPHRCLGRVEVKGKSRAVTVYEIIDAPDVVRIRTREAFESALASFEAHRYSEAAAGFQSVIEIDPSDQAARYYLKKIADSPGPSGLPAPPEEARN